MMDKRVLTWSEVAEDVRTVLDRVTLPDSIQFVVGVPRGGWPPALMVAQLLGLPLWDRPAIEAVGRPDVLVVDDLVDSGRTAAPFLDESTTFLAVYRKTSTPATGNPAVDHAAIKLGGWAVFPWEPPSEHVGPTDAVVRLLEFIGEDPTRPGLVDTPARVLRAFAEMTAGYQMDPSEVLGRVFDDRADEMVVLRSIPFHSLCEHHLLGFSGTATVGYVPAPDRGVVGLSKLARVVDVFARRLQVQERLTGQIADAIESTLEPLGVGVVVTASHSCMTCRGVAKSGAEMVTSSLRGVFRDPTVRAEFLGFA